MEPKKIGTWIVQTLQYLYCIRLN